MAGHSKWAQIKRKKAVTDARRGQAFTKFIREITVAAREGGGEPEFNPRLRLAIDTAKAANMPQENIERAIKRGTGELEGVSYEEVVYEAYGPGGVAIYIQAMTDNQNRTVAALRHLLDRNGGNLGTSGSVAWQFAQKGRIRVNASLHGEEETPGGRARHGGRGRDPRGRGVRDHDLRGLHSPGAGGPREVRDHPFRRRADDDREE